MADPVDAISGTARVTPPTTGRPWDKYELTMCEVVSGQSTNCRTLPLCPAAANANGDTICPISGLKAQTDYIVTAVAIQADGTRSPASNPDGFTTPEYP